MYSIKFSLMFCLIVLVFFVFCDAELVKYPRNSLVPSWPSLSYLQTYIIPTEGVDGVDFSKVVFQSFKGVYCVANPSLCSSDSNPSGDDIMSYWDDDSSASTGYDMTLHYLSWRQPYRCGRQSSDNLAYDEKTCKWSSSGFGVEYNEGVYFCCTKESTNLGMPLCDQSMVNMPIIDQELFAKSSGTYLKASMNMKAGSFNSSIANFERLSSQNSGYDEAGFYMTVLLSCDSGHAGTVIIANGDISVRSGGNLLPGSYTGAPLFYTVSTVISCAFLLLYSCSLYRNSRSDILSVHSHFYVNACLLVIEALFQCIMYWDWNTHGVRNFGLKIATLVVSVSKRTALRFILLMLSLGLGISTPTLPKRTWLVICSLSLAYFVLSLVFLLDTNLDQKMGETGGRDDSTATVLLQMLISLVNVIFYVYIFESLLLTIKALKDEKQNEKARTYVRLRSILTYAVVTAVGFTLLSVVDFFAPIEAFGPYVWFFDNAWVDLMYILVSMAVTWVWRPRRHLGGLADMIELANFSDDDDDDVGGGYGEVNFHGDDSEDDEEKLSGAGEGEGGFDLAALQEMADDSD